MDESVRFAGTLSVMGLIFLLSAFPQVSLAATNDDQLANKLRQEIANLEEKIKQGEAGRRGAIEQLQDIDRKIELRRRLIKELERTADKSSGRIKTSAQQIARLEQELEILSTDLNGAEESLVKLKSDAAGRMIYFYKTISGTRLALLAGARDLNDLARRRKYIAAIEGFDRRALDKITEQRNRIENDKQQREELRSRLSLDQAHRLSELDNYRSLIRERKIEEEAQLKERTNKADLLSRIENDNNLLRALLEERKEALEEIEREIARLEKEEKKSPGPDFVPGTPFRELIGRLLPPVRKLEVTQPFGPSRHPKLGTTTINPGIDLAASPGELVRAAAGGKVTRIAWLRGFGNTVILSHGDGFYTVYARLDAVAVGEGQIVDPGQTLGQVGDGGASSGVHFEVWSKREKQDPMKWLKK